MQLLYGDKFTFIGFLISVAVIFILVIITILAITKTPSFREQINQNNESVKLIGRVFSIVYLILTTILLMPILNNLLQVFSCSKFTQGSSYECGSAIQISMIVTGLIAFVLATILTIGNVMFDQYMGILSTVPWGGKSIYLSLLKISKKIVLIVVQFMGSEITLIIIASLAFLFDLSMIVDLVIYEVYCHEFVQIVEIIAEIILIWWDFGIIFSVVVDLLDISKQNQIYYSLSFVNTCFSVSHFIHQN